MRILIVGAGGVGGYFGGRLVESGAEVSFLVRAVRARQLAKHGLVIESQLGGSRQSVTTMTSVEGIEPPDIIIVACKAYSLDSVLDAISDVVRPGTVILPLLNGVAHLEVIDQRFPKAMVWAGLAHIAVNLGADGEVKHLNTLHTFMFGLRPGQPGGYLAECLKTVLAESSIDGQLRPQIEQDIWGKFVFLSCLAASTCLMRASIGTILETPAGEQLILQLLDEASGIAKAEGIASDPDQSAFYRSLLTERGSTFTASMLRDIELGQLTEAEHILGDLVRRGKKHRRAVPALEIALTHLRVYELCRADGNRPAFC